MERYSGATCPYCGKPFFDGDDIVVCPDCGAPHHRACWKEHGVCAFSASHGDGHEWQPPAPAAPDTQEGPDSDGSAENGKVCPRCGSNNPSACVFCETCGSPLDSDSGAAAYTFPYESIQGDEVFDGVPAKDIVEYVGDNSAYFLPRFKMFSKGRGSDWNWSAFFFTYFYLFYRKMYSLGFFVMLATMILSLPSLALYLVDYQELLIKEGLLGQMFFTLANPELAMTFSNVAWVLLWVMRGFLMLYTNRLYYGRVLEQIHRIREHGFEDKVEYSSELVRRGRTNRTIVAVVAIGYVVLSTLAVIAAVAMNLTL